MNNLKHSAQQVQQTVKRVTGHPTLNMIILGSASGLMLVNTVLGFLAASKLGSDTQVSGAKKALMVAGALSLVSVIMLILGLYLIHRHNARMEKAFNGFFSFTLLVLTGGLMLVSGILFAYAISKLGSTNYGTEHKLAVVGAVLALSGVGILGVSFLTAIMALGGKKLLPGAQVHTQVDQQPPYTDLDGAEKQLSELQVGSGVNATRNPQGVGAQ